VSERVIVQIATASEDFFEDDGAGPTSYPALFALADDGTVWLTYPSRSGAKWERVPALPTRTVP